MKNMSSQFNEPNNNNSSSNNSTNDNNDSTQEKQQSKPSEAPEIKKSQFFKWFIIILGVATIAGTLIMTLFNLRTKTTQLPNHSSNFYINDYSGVFTSETENFIMNQAILLSNSTGAQIVVAAVPDTQTESLETYSLALSNKWGIGSENLDNGVLILFTTTEAHVRMEVGQGLEGCIPDGVAGRILDQWAVDAKDNNRWNEAAINTWVATAQIVYNEYDITPPTNLSFVKNVSETPNGSTTADLDYPAPITGWNRNPIGQQLLLALFSFWRIFFVPYMLVSLFTYQRIFWGFHAIYGRRGFGGGMGGFSGGGFGGGGFRGGGGGFGGGGASR